MTSFNVKYVYRSDWSAAAKQQQHFPLQHIIDSIAEDTICSSIWRLEGSCSPIANRQSGLIFRIDLRR